MNKTYIEELCGCRFWLFGRSYCKEHAKNRPELPKVYTYSGNKGDINDR